MNTLHRVMQFVIVHPRVGNMVNYRRKLFKFCCSLVVLYYTFNFMASSTSILTFFVIHRIKMHTIRIMLKHGNILVELIVWVGLGMATSG